MKRTSIDQGRWKTRYNRTDEEACRIPGNTNIRSDSNYDPTMKSLLLFVLTALAEIVGCYLPYLWLQRGKSAWLLVPAVLSLGSFAWLLTLHPTATSRAYAAFAH